uniref:HNH/ENDO VII family nuclease n=1 Tax=Megamonas funiformis TaxID=437897 RepID=UPI002676C5C1|nr:HNH/ENDO VII family nuclease [Megamonas funiformis]
MNDGERIYKNDAFNRVTRVETTTGQVQINRYDAEGLRYEMEENKKLVQFIFNENREVVVEKSDSDIKRLIRSYDLWASECEPEKTWYHYASDEQGSTVFITDDNKVCNRYDYDAWGNLITCEEIIPNRFLYTGQQFDQITQQYYLRARYYNPVIARFTKEDIYRGDGLNLYTYCDNNPIIYYDPSGYAACGPQLKNPLEKKYTPVEYKGTVNIKGNVRDVSRRVYQRNDIDWDLEIIPGVTNRDLALKGQSPYANDRTLIELHHLTQKEPGAMVEIPASTHDKYSGILHGLVENGKSFRRNPVLNKQYNNFRRKYWRWRVKNIK